MFVRKKNNRSGTVIVVIVSKQSGAYREIHRVGTSSKEPEIASLVEEGKDWIRRQNTIWRRPAQNRFFKRWQTQQSTDSSAISLEKNPFEL